MANTLAALSILSLFLPDRVHFPLQRLKITELHFPFNYTRSMKASLSQWDIKSNLLLDFGQVSPPLYILKRDKRRKRKERGRDAPLPAFDMYAILGAAAAILKPWGLKPKKKKINMLRLAELKYEKHLNPQWHCNVTELTQPRTP